MRESNRSKVIAGNFRIDLHPPFIVDAGIAEGPFFGMKLRKRKGWTFGFGPFFFFFFFEKPSISL